MYFLMKEMKLRHLPGLTRTSYISGYDERALKIANSTTSQIDIPKYITDFATEL